MAGIGELLLGLTGAANPRERLLATMGRGGAAGATQAPAGAPAGTDPAAPAGAAPQGAPPQPEAYQSPPDLASLYTEMASYGKRSDGIDRSVNTLLSGLSTKDSHRRELLAAANSIPQSGSNPEEAVGNVMKLRTMQSELAQKAAARANLPTIAKKYGLDLNTATYLYDTGKLEDVIAQAEKRQFGDATKYGLTPVYAVGPDGKATVIQMGNDGTAVAPKLPEGYTIARDPVKLDGGDHWILLDPQTRQPVGKIAKDVEGEALAKGRGAAQAEAENKLGGVETITKTTNDIIDNILSDENDSVLEDLTGASSYLYRWLPGASKDVQAKIDQLTGAAFLQSMEYLRGTGQITEIEGAKATAAIARLNQAQTKEGFRSSLVDLRNIMRSILTNAQKRASGGTKVDAPAAGTAVDDIDALLNKYPGN